MDRATDGLNVDGHPGLPPGFDLTARGPLDRATAIAVLSQADDLMELSEPEQALELYTRAIGTADRDVSAAGFYGAGNALYRLDRETEACAAWERATSLGETAVAYRAWRQLAAARVREGDLRGAVEAYRECEKRAPSEDRAEIASRLGWLNKETGNAGAAQRYFARSRGDSRSPFMTYLIIAVTSVVSLAAMSGAVTSQGYLNPGSLEAQLVLSPLYVAHGDYYRLLSVVLVHDPTDILHLLFNMYALWFAGLLVEKMYGSWLTLVLYVISGVAASAASYAFGLSANGWSVGASGAIFGLFGIVLVATRVHHAILDAQSRAIASQVGLLIVLNLVLGFSGIFNVDNFAHVGGLTAGLWLAFVLPPSHVQTLSSVWQTSRRVGSQAQTIALRAAGLAALVAVVAGVVAYGTIKWQADPNYQYYYGAAPHPAPVLVASGAQPEVLRLAIR
ncbi:MAG: rhomboid family intramembrane serine protease [Candidatus Limnocylindrales bacterium]|jgi:membrane associated rhomboid family serine protease